MAKAIVNKNQREEWERLLHPEVHLIDFSLNLVHISNQKVLRWCFLKTFYYPQYMQYHFGPFNGKWQRHFPMIFANYCSFEKAIPYCHNSILKRWRKLCASDSIHFETTYTKAHEISRYYYYSIVKKRTAIKIWTIYNINYCSSIILGKIR